MACAGEGKRSFRTSTVQANAALSTGIHELSVPWLGPLPEPGQFFMLRPTRSGVFLGRPISVAGVENTADAGGATDGGAAEGRCVLRFIVAERGQGTAELVALRRGDGLELSGPLGNTWPGLDAVGMSAGAQAGTQAGTPGCTDRPEGRKPAALVGGGIGIAPLLFLAKTLPARSYDFYAGFRSRSYGLEGLEARTTVVATEDGCEGCTGRIPDFLESADYGAVYACGPEAMLRAVVDACARSGTPCWISLERRMACGVGACLGCTVPTAAGNRRCCVDGPVFPSQEVVFDA